MYIYWLNNNPYNLYFSTFFDSKMLDFSSLTYKYKKYIYSTTNHGCLKKLCWYKEEKPKTSQPVFQTRFPTKCYTVTSNIDSKKVSCVGLHKVLQVFLLFCPPLEYKLHQ